MDYSSHSECLEALKKAQESEHDMRDLAREDKAFVESEAGQWEQGVYDSIGDRPKYTFDLVDPVVDMVAGDMEKRDFSLKISPANGEASDDIAETYDGLIRNIENLSNAVRVYNSSGREMVTCGLDGWQVVQKYVDGDSFDQDLAIEKIPNYLDRVWFGHHEEPDASDARHCWVLNAVDPDEFKRRWPEENDASVTNDRSTDVYFYRPDAVMVGSFRYLKEKEREIALMTNGKSYPVDEKYESVVEELAQLGVAEKERRKRKYYKLYTRLFSNDGWLGEEQETVFNHWLNVIPVYGNHRVIENKIVYRGVVRKLKDPQRVFNYAKSREIEEGALAPRAKIAATSEQIDGYEDEWGALNTSADPVLPYNHVDGQPQPYQISGAQVNPSLTNTSESMKQLINMSAGMFSAAMGDNPGLQSGVAIESLQNKSDQGNNKYIESREIAMTQTGRILIDAIPRVYTEGRQVRLLSQDGSQDMAVIGDKVPQVENGQIVGVEVLNDLSQGTYDVICSSGPDFGSKQNETVKALTEIGQYNPEFLQISSDIIARNIPAPGMDDVADRHRQVLFNQGAIPEDQWTDDERERAAQAQQQPKEDPALVLAKAEEAKAQSDLMNSQTKHTQLQADIAQKQEALKIQAFEAETKRLDVQNDQVRVQIEAKAKAASAAKDLAEAESQDIENQAVESGISQLVEQARG